MCAVNGPLCDFALHHSFPHSVFMILDFFAQAQRLASFFGLNDALVRVSGDHGDDF